MADTKIKPAFGIAPYEAPEARLDAEAEAAYKAGRVVSHERVMEWLGTLANGDSTAAPRA